MRQFRTDAETIPSFKNHALTDKLSLSGGEARVKELDVERPSGASVDVSSSSESFVPLRTTPSKLTTTRDSIDLNLSQIQRKSLTAIIAKTLVTQPPIIATEKTPIGEDCAPDSIRLQTKSTFQHVKNSVELVKPSMREKKPCVERKTWTPPGPPPKPLKTPRILTKLPPPKTVHCLESFTPIRKAEPRTAPDLYLPCHLYTEDRIKNLVKIMKNDRSLLRLFIQCSN